MHHLRPHSSKGDNKTSRTALQDKDLAGLSAPSTKVHLLQPNSETLQLPFSHFRFISHCFLKVRGSCRHPTPAPFFFYCMYVRISSTFHPVLLRAHQCPFSAMLLPQTLGENSNSWKLYHFLSFGVFSWTSTCLKSPHVHLLT